MQPPTDPTAARSCITVDELYRRHPHELQHAVARAVRAPSELIEDACQTAWAIMLSAQPPCHRFGWLRAVAIHEAYRLLAIIVAKQPWRPHGQPPRNCCLAPISEPSTTRWRRAKRFGSSPRSPSANAPT